MVGWGGVGRAGGTISCGLFWERSQVSLFIPRRLFADDDERGSVNIKRHFHGLLWKGGARRLERR